MVTTRSVLIYIEAKAQALAEFYRVLKPQGRLSIYEPINRFASAPAPHLWRGYDVTPVQALAEKITAVYRRVTPEDTDPMLTFDERDMLHWVEQAGFTDIEMDYKAWIKPYARAPNHSSLVSELPQVVALS